MYQNVVIGTPLVEPWMIFAENENDWRENELPNTLFTETRYLPAILKEAGLVKSTGEVRRNRKELNSTLTKPNFFRVKWGKNFLHILVGPDSAVDVAQADEFSGDPWPFPKIPYTTFSGPAHPLKTFLEGIIRTHPELIYYSYPEKKWCIKDESLMQKALELESKT